MRKNLLIAFLVILCQSVNAQHILSLNDGRRSEGVGSSLPTRDIQEVPDGIIVTYYFDKALLYPDDVYQDSYWWKVDGFGYNEKPTEPAIPLRMDQFSIPKGSTAQIEIISKEYIDYDYTLTPAREPLINSSNDVYDRQTVKPVAVTNKWFPENPIDIKDIQVYRGNGILNVKVSPIQYNSSTKTVRAYCKLEYKVKFVNDGTDVLSHAPAISINDVYLNNITLNGTLSQEFMAPTSGTTVPFKQDYLILSVPKYAAAVNLFAEWKKILGFNVHVIVYDKWTESTVKAQVKNAYMNNENLYYLLIIGDHEDVPAANSSLKRQHVTDLFYGCMDGSNDNTPDIYRGRLSVSSEIEATTVVNKIIQYEKSPINTTSFYSNGINCACFQDDSPKNGYADRRFAQTSEEVRSYLISQGKNVERVYYTDSEVFPTNWNNGIYSNGERLPDELLKPNFKWDGNENDIREGINSGVFYVLHRDHGTVDGWFQPAFHITDIPQLDNRNKLPIVFSINCLTGKFNGRTCFSESFLRHPSGGCVAIYGATEVSYSGYNDVMTGGMFDAIWNSPGLRIKLPKHSNYGGSTPVPTYRLGQILDQGLNRMEEIYGIDTITAPYTKEIFHCFGDPSMLFPTETPENFSNVTCKREGNKITVSLDTNDATISFRDHKDSKVTSYIGHSAVYYTEHPENVSVCISGHNRIPYISYGSENGEIYIQNEIVSGHKDYNGKIVKIGSSVTDSQSRGSVEFREGEIEINANTVEFQPNTTIAKGTKFSVKTN